MANLKPTQKYFTVIGKAKVGDFTFKLDEKSKKNEDYIYSQINLKVDTGSGNQVTCKMMGGYDQEKSYPIRCRSKEDFSQEIIVDWEDRFNENIMEGIADFNKIKVGIEKDENDKTFVKHFLHEYDAIQYISEHLEDGTTVMVKGGLKYSTYNDNLQVEKQISEIYLSKSEEDKFRATLIQGILVDDMSIDAKSGKEDNEIYIDAKVIDYNKEYRCREKGKEHNGMIPYPVRYVIKVEEGKEELVQKMIKAFFKVKKNKVRQIAVEGYFVEGVETQEVNKSDIPDDMQELIDMGLYSEEEVINKLTVRGAKVSKMYIRRPYITDEGVKMDDEIYKMEDLILPSLDEDDDNDGDGGSEGEDWLNDL